MDVIEFFYFGVQKNVASTSLSSQHPHRKNFDCAVQHNGVETMREKADSDLVRRQNRRLVLDALRQHGSMARIELGRLTGLSPASITSISGQLIAEGLVREKEEGVVVGLRQRRGRPQVQLEINPAATSIMVVKLSIDGIELVLADFSGAIIARETSRISTYDADANSFGGVVAEEIATFLSRHRIKRSKVARIAVAVQGVANSQQGTIVWSPAFINRNIPVCEPITRKLGIACSIANDANLMAEALIASDPQRFAGTSAIVFIGYGVGMGLIIDGQVYHGTTGAASEFGHMNHLPDGPLCRCGRRGCVEAYAADYAIMRMARGDEQAELPLQTRVTEDEFAGLERRARDGDKPALAAFAAAGEALGYGIARMASLLSPEHVLLAGPGTRAISLIEPRLRSAFEEALVEDLRRQVAIATIPVDNDMIVRGGIADALHHLDREVFAAGMAEARIASS